jgi:hypothetical protein
MLAAQCLIPDRAILQFGAHRLIVIAAAMDAMSALSSLASRAGGQLAAVDGDRRSVDVRRLV